METFIFSHISLNIWYKMFFLCSRSFASQLWLLMTSAYPPPIIIINKMALGGKTNLLFFDLSISLECLNDQCPYLHIYACIYPSQSKKTLNRLKLISSLLYSWLSISGLVTSPCLHDFGDIYTSRSDLDIQILEGGFVWKCRNLSMGSYVDVRLT